MSEENIQVTVVKRSDRKYFMMRYIDPVTGKQAARSTRTTRRREAERIAAKWEAELHEGRYRPASKITWAEFREQYEEQKLATLADKTQESAGTAMNHLERVINPKRLISLTSATLSRFQAALRKEGMKDTTIAAYLAHLRPAFSWAVSMDMLREVPDMHSPKRAKGRKLMRGRPITTEEFERMIQAVPKVRQHDFHVWERHLTGLWLSGLRLEESTVLSWDEDSPFAVDLSGRHPRFRIYAEAEKGHQDRLLPMTPDFAQFLLGIPEEERVGRVFRLNGHQTGNPITPRRVGRIISEIGKRTGVIVNRTRKKVKEKIVDVKTDKATGKVRVVEKVVVKYASAHDLRRAFGTRWARKVMPAVLQRLMRHAAIETTLKYYVDLDADELADELWDSFGGDPNVKPNPNYSGQRKVD